MEEGSLAQVGEPITPTFSSKGTGDGSQETGADTSPQQSSKFYIHFQNPQRCQAFLASYEGNKGHLCCSGKGCLLLDVTSKDVQMMKKKFLEDYSRLGYEPTVPGTRVEPGRK